MRVLIAETDQQLARERAEQLHMDSHHTYWRSPTTRRR
jgi:hypothetical protein